MSSDVDLVLEALRSGGVAIIPTDTVYGLAADPGSARGVAEIFEIKGRPPSKGLPILGANLEALSRVAVFDDRALRLAETFWPGPLTLVLARAAGFDHDLGGHANTIAVRVPDRAVTLELLRGTGPLAVTSANPSGEPAPRTADEASISLRAGVPVLDDGPGEGRASTVLSLVAQPEVLRAGSLTWAELERALS